MRTTTLDRLSSSLERIPGRTAAFWNFWHFKAGPGHQKSDIIIYQAKSGHLSRKKIREDDEAAGDVTRMNDLLQYSHALPDHCYLSHLSSTRSLSYPNPILFKPIYYNG
jgi:hypothetical protein